MTDVSWVSVAVSQVQGDLVSYIEAAVVFVFAVIALVQGVLLVIALFRGAAQASHDKAMLHEFYEDRG